MNRMQVVIPMSGVGKRFTDAGITTIKPLLDVCGRPVIARLLALFPRDWRFVFICNEEHLKKTRLAEVLKECAPEGEIVSIAPHKRGPVHAVLEAKDAVRDDLPTIINYCDFAFRWDPNAFLRFVEKEKCDGAVLCYRGFHPHYLGNTLYAYCREENGRILEIKEKAHFTDDRTKEFASSGSYYFSSGGLAKQYCARAVEQELQVKGEYYASLVYNPMIADGLKVMVYEIPYFLQWGTPQDLEDYRYWHRAFEKLAESRPPSGATRLLMPMAGRGGRFAGFKKPKPLIPVSGKPMFLSARERLPEAGKPVLVLQKAIEERVRRADPASEKVVLDGPTAGPAETVERALSRFNPEEPVLVSNCDHGLVWDDPKWRETLAAEPDVVVVGQRGYPGARRSPESFAYIKVDGKGGFRGASVKKPLSGTPQKDLVLVGTFYFKSVRLLGELITELKKKKLKVKGEFYLDSVVELAAKRGLSVRVFESDAYLNWGDPDSLKEFGYWDRYFRISRL